MLDLAVGRGGTAAAELSDPRTVLPESPAGRTLQQSNGHRWYHMNDKTEPTGPSLQRSLQTVNLTLFGLVAMGPIGGVTLYGLVAVASQGAVLSSFLLAALCVGLTGLSFATMAAVAPGAGSVQSYAAKAFGPALGFLGGWAMLLDYVLITALVVVFGAYYLVGALPWLRLEPVAAAFALFSFVVAFRGVTWSARADLVVTGLQGIMVGLIVLFGAWILLGQQANGAVEATPIWPQTAQAGSVISGASVAIIAFLGFDVISTLAEEVSGEQVGRSVGVATLIAIAVMAATFLVLGWTISGLGGGLGGRDPATAGSQIVAERLPVLAVPLGIVAGAALGLGVNLATTTGASRLLFALARTGALPPPLKRIHPHYHSPWVAVITVSATVAGLAFIALDQVDLLAGLVSFGALTGFLLVNVAVIAHHGIALGSRLWMRHWLMPCAGAAVVLYVMAGINPLALEIGLAWLAAGLVIFLVSSAGRFAEDRIGRGSGPGEEPSAVMEPVPDRELSDAVPPAEPPSPQK
jgi:amino acid transporter